MPLRLTIVASLSLALSASAWAAKVEEPPPPKLPFSEYPARLGDLLRASWGALVPRIEPANLLRLHPPAAVGSPVDGSLLFPVQMKPSKAHGIHIRHPHIAWTVPEVIDALTAAHRHVRKRLPGGPDLQIGDISQPGGGRFRPHFSHRNGLDVDLRYYLLGVAPGDHAHHFVGEHLLDCPRTWAFIDHLVSLDAVELMYMDVRLQKRLYTYARKELKRTDAELDPILSYPKAKRRASALIQHASGHFNHLHIRFKAPWARGFGALYTPKAADILRKRLEIHTTGRLRHTVRRGETLGQIAERHKVKLEDLLRWNGLRKTSKIRPGQTLTIRVRATP